MPPPSCARPPEILPDPLALVSTTFKVPNSSMRMTWPSFTKPSRSRESVRPLRSIFTSMPSRTLRGDRSVMLDVSTIVASSLFHASIASTRSASVSTLTFSMTRSSSAWAQETPQASWTPGGVASGTSVRTNAQASATSARGRSLDTPAPIVSILSRAKGPSQFFGGSATGTAAGQQTRTSATARPWWTRDRGDPYGRPSIVPLIISIHYQLCVCFRHVNESFGQMAIHSQP